MGYQTGYFTSKAIIVKSSRETILQITEGKGVHTSSKNMYSKGNVIERLEFEFSYCVATAGLK